MPVFIKVTSSKNGGVGYMNMNKVLFFYPSERGEGTHIVIEDETFDAKESTSEILERIGMTCYGFGFGGNCHAN